jgi:hypothetical protein
MGKGLMAELAGAFGSNDATERMRVNQAVSMLERE